MRWLFEIAEDSAEHLDGYVGDGDVLIATLDQRPVGLRQITETEVAVDELEINILAVDDELRRQGVGRTLVGAASPRLAGGDAPGCSCRPAPRTSATCVSINAAASGCSASSERLHARHGLSRSDHHRRRPSMGPRLVRLRPQAHNHHARLTPDPSIGPALLRFTTSSGGRRSAQLWQHRPTALDGRPAATRHWDRLATRAPIPLTNVTRSRRSPGGLARQVCRRYRAVGGRLTRAGFASNTDRAGAALCRPRLRGPRMPFAGVLGCLDGS